MRPATLAPAILTGMLRDSLDFEGLVVTDALDMGAVVNDVRAPAERRCSRFWPAPTSC